MKAADRRRIWGLTGSIASGKSEVERILEAEGCSVIDADAISREITSNGHPFLKTVRSRLGPDVLSSDGLNLDRAQCRVRIGKDPQFKKDLESVLHPEIKRISHARLMEALKAEPGLVFYSAALLLEANREGEFENILLVTAPDKIRLQRLMKRDGMTEENALQLMNAQMSQSEKRKRATFEIENDGSLEDLKKRTKDFLKSASKKTVG